MAHATHKVLEPEAGELQYARKYVWEFPVRLCHWVNALSICVLFATGMYISWPIFSSYGEPWQNFLMGRVREIHFISGYVMLVSFLLRIYWFYVGSNYARSGFPLFWRRVWWGDLRDQAMHYMRLDRGQVHVGHNALAGLSYTIFVIGLGWFQILTGLALYSQSNPGGFWDRLVGWIIPLLGGAFRVHMWHHTAAWSFVVFVILHLYIVLYDDRQFKNGLVSSIVSGFKFYEKKDLDNDRWIS